jgi:SAM-dependent methyltransferase
VAIDVDTGLLEPLRSSVSNLEVRRSDITTTPTELEAFDFVHARLVLEHVSARGVALRQMVAALKPGGVLLVEEFDHVNWLPAVRADASVPLLLNRFLRAYRLTMEARGADLEIGRFLTELLETEALEGVDADGRAVIARGRSVAGRAFHLTFQQARDALIATGAITAGEMDDVLLLFMDPGFSFVLPLVIAAWGYRSRD